MSYQILYDQYISKKELKKISPEILREIIKNIEEKLTTRPEIFGKPLQNSLKGYRRMRVRDFRILYKIDGDAVRIEWIEKKPEVYFTL